MKALPRSSRVFCLMTLATGMIILCSASCVDLNPGGGDGVGDFCAGIAGIPCGAGQFCQFEAGTCQIADNGGVCTIAPTACIELFDPVCGCNGETYTNACFASMAGASVDHEGACVR